MDTETPVKGNIMARFIDLKNNTEAENLVRRAEIRIKAQNIAKAIATIAISVGASYLLSRQQIKGIQSENIFVTEEVLRNIPVEEEIPTEQ